MLLPGVTVPLHIFEPRYRTLLRDVTESGGGFGIIAPPDGAHESELASGRIGCVATVRTTETLPDGRANILVEGTSRFRFIGYVDSGTPYRMGEVTAYEDLPDDPAALLRTAASVRSIALRAITASMTVGAAHDEAPALSEDGASLSFEVAHLLQVEREVLYEILAERHALARLQRVEALLVSALSDLEAAADLHGRAKTNGHHHGPPPV